MASLATLGSVLRTQPRNPLVGLVVVTILGVGCGATHREPADSGLDAGSSVDASDADLDAGLDASVDAGPPVYCPRFTDTECPVDRRFCCMPPKTFEGGVCEERDLSGEGPFVCIETPFPGETVPRDCYDVPGDCPADKPLCCGEEGGRMVCSVRELVGWGCRRR